MGLTPTHAPLWVSTPLEDGNVSNCRGPPSWLSYRSRNLPIWVLSPLGVPTLLQGLPPHSPVWCFNVGIPLFKTKTLVYGLPYMNLRADEPLVAFLYQSIPDCHFVVGPTPAQNRIIQSVERSHPHFKSRFTTPLMGQTIHSEATVNSIPLMGFPPLGRPTPLLRFPPLESLDHHSVVGFTLEVDASNLSLGRTPF